jgi:hypothetical protein
MHDSILLIFFLKGKGVFSKINIWIQQQQMSLACIKRPEIMLKQVWIKMLLAWSLEIKELLAYNNQIQDFSSHLDILFTIIAHLQWTLA